MWIWNFSTTMSHSLLYCGKWWRARYCCAQECPTIRSHCLWHSGLIFSNVMDHLRTRNLSDAVDKSTDWERFQSLTSELISPRIPVILWEEADKAARDFTASIVSAYRLSTRTLTASDQNNDLPGPECLLNYKMRLRKLASNPGRSM
jgi:hypothetical protein